MKAFLLTLFALSFSSSSFACPPSECIHTKIICKAGRSLVTSTLSELNVERMWEKCQENFVTGNGLCYSGEKDKAIMVLKLLSKYDVLGDEYSMENIRKTRGSHTISYEVWDGPNSTDVASVRLKPCH